MKVRTEAKREAIVVAAAALFQELGYERASMNELAKRLGGSKATLYGYFESKEVLFGAVVRALATTHLAEAALELRGPVESAAELESVLLRFAERMLLVLGNDAGALALNRMVVAEAGRSEVGQVFHASGPSECIAALAALLGLAMERGLLRRGDPRLRARQATALITAEVNARMYERDPPPIALPAIRKIAERAVEMFLAGAAPR
ncbi:MAG: TetR/AcrR family transcriptional regulator C-terminal domain-containing protein [Solimonas sp.]